MDDAIACRAWACSVLVSAAFVRSARRTLSPRRGLTSDCRRNAGRCITDPDGIFRRRAECGSLRLLSKIDRPMGIVAETEQIADRRNSFVKSRAEISYGSGGRCSVVSEKIAPLDQGIPMAWDNRVE
jgi:hypothetical protein